MTQALVAFAIVVSTHTLQQPPAQMPPTVQVPVTAPPPAAPPPQDPVPAAKPALEIAKVAPLTPAEIQERHDNIGMLESVLTRAVANGARSFQVNSQVTVGFTAGQQPRARGFVLDGYGLFFDVEVPEIDVGVEMTMLQFQKLLEQNQSPSNAGPRRTTSSQVDPADNDPNEPYRQAVIAACTSAMLDYSKNLDVQPNEWLTVALRGSDAPAGPTLSRDPTIRMLRIKGSDLADYFASRITKAEAVKRVEKREF